MLRSSWNDDRDRNTPTGRPGGVRPTVLLPILRAAMARGEGPPAVLAWVRAQGHPTGRAAGWTPTDEVRARALARQLAATLAGGPDNRGRADPGTEQLGETFAPKVGPRG